MTSPREFVFTVLIVAAALSPKALTGQPVAAHASDAQRRISVDITGGVSAVRGGREPYVNDGGVAAELLVGLRRPARRGPMHAVAAGIRGDAGQTCYVSPPPSGSGKCAASAPTVRHLGVLTGYEYRRSGSSVRALLGPTLYSASRHAGVGGRLHLSAAVGAPRIALTVGVNGNWLTLFNGSTLRYYSSAFGLRFQ